MVSIWSEYERNEFEKLVSDWEDKYDDIEIDLKGPLWRLFPPKISYEGDGFSGAVRVRKRNDSYLSFSETNYRKDEVEFDPRTKIHEIADEDNERGMHSGEEKRIDDGRNIVTLIIREKKSETIDDLYDHIGRVKSVLN